MDKYFQTLLDLNYINSQIGGKLIFRDSSVHNDILKEKEVKVKLRRKVLENFL